MNEHNFWAHFHLAVNDVPVIGFVLSALFLILSLTTPHRDSWANAGMLTVAISILGVVAAFFSGDPALHPISGKPGTSARALTQHHIRGLVAVGLALITAVVAIISKVKARKAGGKFATGLIKLVLLTTILSAAAFAWTSLAGGRINHPELQLPDDRKEGPARPH